MSINLHHGDLPEGLDLGPQIAIDTETMGLNPHRDRLCLVQLSSGDGNAHLVKFDQGAYHAPRLCAQLSDPNRLKIFHFGRFDIAVLSHYLNIDISPVFCTKIASRLTRTFGAKHGLGALIKDLLSIEISKQQQTSDWGAKTLTKNQLVYAANDVLYLHQLKKSLDALLDREHRTSFARECFKFLPTQAKLDLEGFGDENIFAHS